MAQIREKTSENIPIVLAGNKADLLNDDSFPEAESTAREYGIPFLPTSAKTGQNIQKAFEILCGLIYQKDRDLFQRDKPASKPGSTQLVANPQKNADSDGCCGK